MTCEGNPRGRPRGWQGTPARACSAPEPAEAPRDRGARHVGVNQPRAPHAVQRIGLKLSVMRRDLDVGLGELHEEPLLLIEGVPVEILELLVVEHSGWPHASIQTCLKSRVVGSVGIIRTL